ncbi:MAG: right-handed parallel beta-helix repeat-containing protein [Saprospiraceae bacterium]
MTVQDCFFENTSTGVHISSGGGIQVLDNAFINNGLFSNYAVVVDGAADYNGVRLLFTGNTFAGGSNGISLANMDALTIANIGSPEVHLPVTDGKTTLTGTVIALSNIDNTTIANFDLSAATFGGTALSTINCDNITIQNNITTDRAAGIFVNNSIVSTISGNTLTNNFNNGINVSNGQNCTITNNTFTNCGNNGNTQV